MISPLLIAAALLGWLPVVAVFLAFRFGTGEIGSVFFLLMLGGLAAPGFGIAGYRKSKNKKRAFLLLAFSIFGSLYTVSKFVNG